MHNGVERHFKAEAKASGKLLAFLDLSGEASAGRENQHKVKMPLSVADRTRKPIKVRSDAVWKRLPE